MLTVTDNLLNAMQLLSENLKSPSPAINVTSSSGESVWGGLEEDILSLAVPTDINGKSSRHADLVATESYDPTVMRHQLLILRGEYPAIDLDEALYSWVDELLVKSSHQCGRTVQLMLLLEDLGDLESSHATAVGACRSRDGTKGRSIIPDYDIVNAAGSDVLSDPVVRGSMERSIRIADAVSKLRDLRT